MNLYKFLKEFNFNELDRILNDIDKGTIKLFKNTYYYLVNITFFLMIAIMTFGLKSFKLFLLSILIFFIYNAFIELKIVKMFYEEFEKLIIYYFFNAIEIDKENIDFFEYMYLNDDGLVIQLKEVLLKHRLIKCFEGILEKRKQVDFFEK